MGRASRHKPAKLAKKLQQIREYCGLSMNQLIERIGSEDIPLHKGDISKYESDLREPPLVILLRYARLGNVSVDVLIDDEQDLKL